VLTLPNVPPTPTGPSDPPSSPISLRSLSAPPSSPIVTSVTHGPRPLPPPTSRPPEPEPLHTYACPICFASPTNATLTPCGHIMCGECLFTAVGSAAARMGIVSLAARSVESILTFLTRDTSLNRFAIDAGVPFVVLRYLCGTVGVGALSVCNLV